MDASSVSAAGGIFGALASMAIAQAQLDYQSQANIQAREDQYYFYNDQKNWQSPSNQMYLRSIAGLNPYGDFTTGGVSQPQPVNLADGMSEGFQNLSSSISQGMRNRFERLAQKIAFKQLELQEKRLDLDTQRTDADIKKLVSETKYQDILNAFEEQANPSKLRYQSSLADTQAWQSVMNMIDAYYKPDMYESQINNMIEDVLTKQETRPYLAKDYAIRKGQYDIQAEQWNIEKGILENEKIQSDWDAATIKAVDEYLDSLDKNKNIKPAVKAALKGIVTIAKMYMQSKKPAKVTHNHYN